MSKKLKNKNRIVNAELSLDYEKDLRYHISINATVAKLDTDYSSAADKKELQNMIALSIASIALTDMGLPTIQEILELHYPEALL